MATSLDQPIKQTTGRKSVNTLTKMLNLASSSAAMLHETPKIPKKAPPPELYFNDKSYTLRLDDDVTTFDNETDLRERLAQLPEREIDLVFAGRTALDMSFQVPNGPFIDLQAMIESELAFRSPIQREECFWFWSAQETPNGDWLVEAAIVLKSAIDWVLEALKSTGKTINLARRHNTDSTLRVGVEPDWMKKPSRLAKTSGPVGRLTKIPPALRMPIAAFAVFATSIVALYFVQTVRYNEVAAQATTASARLSQIAAEQAVTQGMDERRSLGAARIAVIGTLAGVLPDGVWLEQILVDADELTLIGYAPSAAEVTQLLSKLPSVTDIEFGSPVTRDNTQNLERFRINAKLTGLLE
jgi:hypothetical protein